MSSLNSLRINDCSLFKNVELIPVKHLYLSDCDDSDLFEHLKSILFNYPRLIILRIENIQINDKGNLKNLPTF
jgi:hypothetical protein